MPEEYRDKVLDTLEEFLKDNNSVAFIEYSIALKELRRELDGYRNGSFIHLNQIQRLEEQGYSIQKIKKEDDKDGK